MQKSYVDIKSVKYSTSKFRGALVTLAEVNAFLHVNGEVVKFTAVGQSICSKGDKYDKDFGELLADLRAMNTLFAEIEKYMIKWSCMNNKEIESKSDLLKDIVGIIRGFSI